MPMISLSEAHKLQLEALEEMNDEKLQLATRHIESIAQLYSDEPEPLFCLANSYLAQKRFGIAIPLYHRIIQLAPSFMPAYNNLGDCYRGVHAVEKGKTVFEYALSKERTSGLLNNYAALFINEGCPEKGLPLLEEALAKDSGNAHAHWNIGLILLELEQWERGFQEYGWGMANKDRMVKHYGQCFWKDGTLDDEPRWWDGKPHPEDTIIVYGEQGVGDEIMFASMLPEIIAQFKHVVYDCHDRLVGLFTESFPGLTQIYPSRKIWDEPMYWTKDVTAQWKICIGDAAEFLRKKEADFPKQPYIKAPESLVWEFLQELSTLPKPLFVISWKGGYSKTRKDLRSIELPIWKPLMDAFPGTWISGQYTEGASDEVRESGLPIIEYPEIFGSQESSEYYPVMADGSYIEMNGEIMKFKEKRLAKQAMKQYGAAVIEGRHSKAFFFEFRAAFLEAVRRLGGRVITINTTLAHLAGAMGIPTTVLTPFKCAWRYGMKREDMVWYPWTLKQVRGGEDEPWEAVMPRVIEHLKREMHLED